MSALKRNVEVHLRVTHLLVNSALGIQPPRGKLGTQTGGRGRVVLLALLAFLPSVSFVFFLPK